MPFGAALRTAYVGAVREPVSKKVASFQGLSRSCLKTQKHAQKQNSQYDYWMNTKGLLTVAL